MTAVEIEGRLEERWLAAGRVLRALGLEKFLMHLLVLETYGDDTEELSDEAVRQ